MGVILKPRHWGAAIPLFLCIVCVTNQENNYQQLEMSSITEILEAKISDLFYENMNNLEVKISNRVEKKIDEISGEIKWLKRETAILTTVINALSLNSNSLNTRLEDVHSEVASGYAKVEFAQVDVEEAINELKSTLEGITQNHQNFNTCASSVEATRQEQTSIWKSLNSTLEEMKECCAPKVLANNSTLNNSTEAANDTVEDAASKCASPFMILPETNECYLIKKHPWSWDDARRECKERGADLAIPQDFSALHRMLLALPRDERNLFYWLGANDRRAHGTQHYWVNGEPVVSVPWHYSEPNYSTADNCIGINHSDGAIHDNYYGCPGHYTIGYICKK